MLFSSFCLKNTVRTAKCLLARFVPTNHARSFSQEILNINTNVAKDVILYKYDNPKYFRYLGLFGLSQYCFWMYLSYIAYTTLRDAPVSPEMKENLPWWRKINLGEQKYRNGITLSCAVIGQMFLIISHFYTIRSVRYLILGKGGKTLTFVTYGPISWRNLIMEVPLKNVSAKESRSGARVQLPLKVQGRWFFYILDMRGEFKNPKLFDSTAGLHRNLSK